MKYLLLLVFLMTTSLSAQVKVLAFSGSSRQDSLNQKLVEEAARLAKLKGAQVTIVNLRDFSLPIYNADFESKQGMPLNAKRFRQLMLSHDRIIIASPEYNGSVSALLKNTLDWASRSEGAQFSADAFKGKKFALMSASPGPGGGSRGLVHLSQVIRNLGGMVISKTISVPNAFKAFDSQGRLVDPNLSACLNSEISDLLN